MRSRYLGSRCRLGALATCLLALLGLGTTSAESRSLSFSVRHRSASTVYLEGGANAGLSVGDRLTVRRNGSDIAEVEVVFVAGFSASCSVLSESRPVEAGDSAILKGAAQLLIEAGGTSMPAVVAPTTQEPSYVAPPRVVQPRTRISGALTFEFESFSDDSGNDLDYDRSQARLNLRGRDLGGMPLSFRVRTRLQEIERSRDLSGGVPRDESRDRLYEVSLRYDAPSGRYSLMGGRLGASPFIGIGYLDGLLAELRAYKTFSVGGFWGNQPDIAELGFESIGQKYGAYTRFSNDRSANPQRFNVILGGIREEGDVDVSREYVLLESYYQSGAVWSFFQRAEIDMNNDWREELSEDSSQLSNLALSARARLSEKVRLSLSYDQFRPYRTEQTRLVPDDLWNSLTRQGFRASINVGRPRQLNWRASVGWRDQEEAEEASTSIGLGVRHADIGAGFSVGADLLGYSNLYTEGGVLRLRGAKSLNGGHEIYLALGARSEDAKIGDGETADGWGRLGFWVELPASFFARGEFEYAAGDSLEGSRFTLGLGYRF